jgi:hypothetical protein
MWFVNGAVIPVPRHREIGEGLARRSRDRPGQRWKDDTVKEYQANVPRDGRFWYIEVPGLEGATQGRNLTEVEEMAREFIAIVTDTDVADVAVTINVELPPEVQRHLDAARALREEEAAARSQAAAEYRAAARALRAEGMTVREIGRALGVSFQRAQQLVA